MLSDTGNQSRPGQPSKALVCGVEESASPRHGVLGIAVPKDYQELVSSVAPYQVSFAGASGKYRAQRFQYRVPGEVAMGVVEQAEPVDIDHQQGELASPASGEGQGIFKSFVDGAPAQETGDGVAIGLLPGHAVQMRDFLLGCLEFVEEIVDLPFQNPELWPPYPPPAVPCGFPQRLALSPDGPSYAKEQGPTCQEPG